MTEQEFFSRYTVRYDEGKRKGRKSHSYWIAEDTLKEHPTRIRDTFRELMVVCGADVRHYTPAPLPPAPIPQTQDEEAVFSRFGIYRIAQWYVAIDSHRVIAPLLAVSEAFLLFMCEQAMREGWQTSPHSADEDAKAALIRLRYQNGTPPDDIAQGRVVSILAAREGPVAQSVVT